MTRNDLKEVVKTKLKAAKILFNAGDYTTSGYLLGYVVECSLKAVICKKLKLAIYPDSGKHFDVFASHDFDRLLMLSGYSEDITLQSNPTLFNYWSILTKDWKPEIRYNNTVYTLNNIQDKITALEDSNDGFLVWIKKRW